MNAKHHLEVGALPLDRTISLNVHNRHGGTGTGPSRSAVASSHQPQQQQQQSSLKDRWYSFRYRPRDDRQRRSNVEEFLFIESLPDGPVVDAAAASAASAAPDGLQEIELSIIIRKDTIRRDLMDSMRTCNGRLQLMELVELDEFDPGGVLPPPNQNELDRLFCWAIYVGASAECLDSLYDSGANSHYSHCGNFTAIHLAAFMGNVDAIR